MYISDNKKIIKIIEYERITEDDIGKEKFKKLELFILEKNNKNRDNDLFLKIASLKNKKYIKAQKYVGVIQFNDGTTIEILPKVVNSDNFNKKNSDYEKAQKILIKMIRTLKNHPFKDSNFANLKSSKMPLFEIFIKMFLDELDKLIKKGVKSSYILKKDNLKYLKGKLLINQNIKRNYIHKERFYTEYEEFSIDRVENRVIKTTLLFLQKRSIDNYNQKMIKRYLIFFDFVSISYDKNSLKKLNLTRDILHYKTILSFCKIFQNNESFSIYKGSNISFALLFNMNTLFESYVGDILRKRIKDVKLQDKRYHILKSKKDKYFTLKPDIIINDGKIILDTKWKELKSFKDISSSDIYQLYAYGMNYPKCKKLYLIYPNKLSENYNGVKNFYFNEDNNFKKLSLEIIFFDFDKEKEFIDKIFI